VITFRTPNIADASALAKLGAASFVDAFGHLYSAENLNAFLSATYSVDTVAAELSSSQRVFRVAEDGQQLIGFCKLGLDLDFDIDLAGRRGLTLKQLYLVGTRTGTGVGGALIAWAIDEARSRSFDDIVLSVWSGNVEAQRFYRRHGFEKIGETIFRVGDHIDEEFLFGLQLTQPKSSKL
jgi:diamine N-acetyltransferase